jgi:uncharacterized iron-regulated protein
MKHQKHYKRFLFLLAMLLTVTFAVAQTDGRTKKQKDYLSFIQGQTISPFDYLSQKIKQYNVVSLGEDHWIKDHMRLMLTVSYTFNPKKSKYKGEGAANDEMKRL